MDKHQLRYKGAPYTIDAQPSPVTAETGRARCTCGWLSEELPTNRARQRAHKEHVENKERIAQRIEELQISEPEPWFDPEAVDGETDPELLDGETEAVVDWNPAVAKLFFRALAKDGSEPVCKAVGVERHSYETGLKVFLAGPESQVNYLTVLLPELWNAANVALRAWRKTSADYKAHDLGTSEGRKTAFLAEQDWLRDFSAGVAHYLAYGAEKATRTAKRGTEGYRQGVSWMEFYSKDSENSVI